MLHPSTAGGTAGPITLGLRNNWRQFSLLVLISAFVGGMVGLERSILPLLAEQEFSVTLYSAILSFIVGFGLVKAIFNLVAGKWVDRWGRKPVLLIGWLFGLPVPFLIMWAPTWGWVVFANLLLGVNQGLCWSTTVIMKIDLVGPRQRGLAMGLNEFAGYLAVGLVALLSGYLATNALRPDPFYLGIALAVAGLLLSAVFVRETQQYVAVEAQSHPLDAKKGSGNRTSAEVFALTSWKDPALFSASQAGLVNNLNDGMVWGIMPLFFAATGLSVAQVGVLAAVYPATWGIAQLGTGALSDRIGRKGLITFGMFTQGLAIWLMLLVEGFWAWALAATLLGVGTAMVYPTLLAVIGDVAHPNWRASAVGVYRFWRDMGYVFGALLSGLIADALGIRWTIGIVGGLTLASGCLVWARMYETLR